jgi:hypothetical protein
MHVTDPDFEPDTVRFTSIDPCGVYDWTFRSSDPLGLCPHQHVALYVTHTSHVHATSRTDRRRDRAQATCANNVTFVCRTVSR